MAANNNSSEEVIIRRNRPGTKTSELYNWPDQDYTEMDSILDGKTLNHVQTPYALILWCFFGLPLFHLYSSAAHPTNDPQGPS